MIPRDINSFWQSEPRCCINAPFTASNNDAGIRTTSFSLRSFFFFSDTASFCCLIFVYEMQQKKWLFIFCSTYCFCSFNDCWTVTQYFPFITFPHGERNSGIVDIFIYYIYLIHCRRKILVRITQFQAILEVGVELFSAKLLLLFFLIKYFYFIYLFIFCSFLWNFCFYPHNL